MKNASDFLGPEYGTRLAMPNLNISFILGVHEPDLFYGKLSQLPILSSAILDEEEEELSFSVWVEYGEDFNRQSNAEAFAADDGAALDPMAVTFKGLLEELGLFGKKAKYRFKTLVELGGLQITEQHAETISKDTCAEVLRRALYMNVLGISWDPDGGIMQGGDHCPNHSALCTGNNFLIGHPSGLNVTMMPRGDCNTAEGEDSDLQRRFTQSGGFWFDVWFGSVAYRGLISHPRIRLEQFTPGSEDDVRATIDDLICVFYPIVYSAKETRDTFNNTFHFVREEQHKH